jgi:hypothetical protein
MIEMDIDYSFMVIVDDNTKVMIKEFEKLYNDESKGRKIISKTANLSKEKEMEKKKEYFELGYSSKEVEDKIEDFKNDFYQTNVKSCIKDTRMKKNWF